MSRLLQLLSAVATRLQRLPPEQEPLILPSECKLPSPPLPPAVVCVVHPPQLRLPRAPAMVISGLALAQIPGSATLHLPGPWVSSIRALALSIALVMGGLELDVGVRFRDVLASLAVLCGGCA